MADDVILDSIKAALGLTKDYTPFDVELKMHINSAISSLRQLGVGPEVGVVVDDTTPWSALLGSDAFHDLENVKTFIYLNVKLLFDSQSMAAHHISAYQKLIEETTWRINVAANPPLENMLPVLEDVDSDG